MRAASRYHVSSLRGAADSVWSPPPTSTATPGDGDTTRVVTRASRSSVNNAAAAVSTLFVDAGCIGRLAPWAQSSSPVIASVMRPVNRPRFGSATTIRNAAARPSAVGTSAESETGLTPGSAVAGAGTGSTASCSLVCLPATNAAAATTTTTSSRTVAPTNRYVERRHRVGRTIGRMFPLISHV